MDIWWKKVVYSKWLKIVSVIGMLASGCLFFIGLLGFTITSSTTSYFETYEFSQAFISKAGYVRDWIVRYDEANIFTEVTQKEIDAYKQKDGRDLSDAEAKEGIIADRQNYYSKIQNELVTTNKNLDYFAVNHKNNRVITNMQVTDVEKAIQELSSRANSLVGDGYYILNFKYGSDEEEHYYSDHYMNDVAYYRGNKFEGQDNYRVYVGLKEKLEAGDGFFTGYENFLARKTDNKKCFQISMIALVMGLVLFSYWIVVVGRDEKHGEIKYHVLDQIPLDVQLILAYIPWRILRRVMDRGNIELIIHDIMEGPQNIAYNMVNIISFFGVLIGVVGLGLLFVSSCLKYFKNGSIIEHIGILKVCKKFYYVKESKGKLLALVGIIIVVNSFIDILLIVTSDFYFSNFYLLIRPILWNVLCGLVILKFVLDYRKVAQGAKDITEGKWDQKIELEKTLPMLEELATSINSIGTGLEKAVGESIKSERLKTELITNVSHDLKTPLTSIISYIDLLKAEQIENETAREYIGILDERSHRLKQLVEDLVEASKAVTGNLTANVQLLRLDELVGQAVGEYLDRIEASNLTLVCDKMDEALVLADGRHMWRVIENLLSNVCKYAMPQTRVYIEVYEKDGYGYCTIKNISREPLNVDPNELTERFVRGDASRTTEGSGLGLAIAQSLVMLQSGKLEISIDGDLFKVIVKMPIGKILETKNKAG